MRYAISPRALICTIACCISLAVSSSFASEPTELRWARIPAGSFLMGCPGTLDQLLNDFSEYQADADHFRDEFPQHPIEITKPFLMSTTEITVGQFRAFCQDTGYKTAAEVDGEGAWGYDRTLGRCVGRDVRFSWQSPGYEQSESHPVVNVTWDDCLAYCRWMTKRANRIVRLPTEAEWEYACRANTKSYYNNGSNPNNLGKIGHTLVPNEENRRLAIQNLNLAENAATTFPVAVGSYPANSFGLFDMHGNVWEWTADWHDPQYYTRSPLQDPSGPVVSDVKVRRGGGWNSFPLWARASFRNWNTPESRCMNLGFRVVGELNPVELAEEAAKQPIRLLFVGDIMLDNGPGNAIQSGEDPFKNCESLLRDADLTIGNLECVLGDKGDQILKPYSFRAARNSPEYLKRHFDLLSLANNHSWDFGPEGILESIRLLEDQKIGYFGAGKDIDFARQGMLVEVRGKKILFLGYNGFRGDDYKATESAAGSAPLIDEYVIEDIQRGKSKLKADYVIPFVHWGQEMIENPTAEQRTSARRWIDAGASAVIGAHPHVVQTVDIYQGAPIVYSLGNFVFDYYPPDPPFWIGWAVRLSLGPHGIEMETTAVQLDARGIPSPIKTDD
jgi:formylglycine-generating enzyme